MEWSDKIEVKKGDLGEKIVRDWLHRNGLVVYEPVTDSAHAFDKLVSRGKSTLVIVEVKTKPRRLYFPDTGIQLKHYNEYKRVSEKYNIPLCIFFVDEYLSEIYCGYLSELSANKQITHNGKSITYPLVKGGIIYFYQPTMRVIHKLAPEQVTEIKKHSSGNYKYK